MLLQPPAADHGEVLGVGVEVLLGRQQRVEGVAARKPAAKAVGVAAVLRRGGPGVAEAVHAEARGELGVGDYVRPEALAHLERWELDFVESGGDLQPRLLRHQFALARVPPHAAEALQRLVDAVEAAAGSRGDDEQVGAVPGDEAEAVLAETVRVRGGFDAQAADGVGGGGGAYHLDPAAGDALVVGGELGGGVELALARVVRHHRLGERRGADAGRRGKRRGGEGDDECRTHHSERGSSSSE